MSIHDLVSAYALDALDADERRDFEAHLATCPSCQEELAGYDDVLGALAEPSDATEAAADDAAAARLAASLRERIAATEQVAEGPSAPTAETAEPTRPEANVTDIRARASAPTGPAAGAESVPSSMPEPVRRQPRRGSRLLVAAASLLGIALAVTAGLMLADRGDSSQLAADIERIRTAEDVVEQPLGLGEAVAYVSASEGVALVGETPGLDDEETYQVWVVPADGSAPVPGPVMADGDSEVVWDTDLDGAAAIAVSVEPEGGSTTPTEVVTAVEL
ncbi:anti-sigma factor [Demequina sp. NBRC 110056]|uniref:anti-sigma factor n=1 Tax=Demequina sp. NBRC 110056 TaxID=1570345 RepID=UPI000A0343E5|nr:anti-sigma factor [Demequina sp. NBRC 110056]